MGSSVVILDRLLDQAEISQSKEHVLEQASYAVADVQHRLLNNFEGLVEEISSELGKPEFNASTDDGSQEKSNPMQILHGPLHIEVGIALFYLALALEEQGKDGEAIDVRKRARKILLAQGIMRN